ncbi:radical SAM protein [Ruminococcus sp.]|uniref:radical SAM/SPASM domain-containing protein n=1 Tax=Ruminococcus sp. TaxID=41978 RepID=UPI0025F3C2E3|nr:radical SAM protein [Ruminococcus sp.]MBQ8966901.1 radical SAM protein [Ruminococcus sp.]
MLDVGMKQEHLRAMAEYRQELTRKPQLRNLFLELTVRCNERCLHCGSSCGEVQSEELTFEQYREFLDGVKADLGVEGKMLCITGGEPLLRKDFFEIMGYAASLGFRWGMTSNGTLIDKKIARRLRQAGMGTISVSIDGLEATHDAFRRTEGGYRKAMEGIQALIDEGGFRHIQVTTVVTHRNIGELDELFEIFDKMDIDSWRVIGIEPMGRALRYPELLLRDDDQRRLMEFIRNKRMAGEPVCYGCSHYLGLEYEHEVRDWYFLCTAGLQTASITACGDIIACLDIERRPEFVQGNILRDRFSRVWLEKFSPFRQKHWLSSEKCRECEHNKFCRGDAFHSLDHNTGEPMVCFKGVLF